MHMRADRKLAGTDGVEGFVLRFRGIQTGKQSSYTVKLFFTVGPVYCAVASYITCESLRKTKHL